MSRHFWSIIIVGLLGLCLINSGAYGTELMKNSRVFEEHLLPCASTSSCVVSWDQESPSYIAPIPYHTNINQAREILLKVLTVVPRTTVVETTDNYIRAESTGKFWGGIDELEFYFSAKDSVIQLRSASQNSNFDLGVNRRRLEQIRLALRDLKI